MLWTSVCVSSSHSSMCEDAPRISCGPVRVPGTYDVVRSNGTGRMTTRARSKSTIVGIVPPNSPTAMCSYSNGSFIAGNCRTGEEETENERRHAEQAGADEEQRVPFEERPPGGEVLDGDARETFRELAQVDV